MPDLLTIDRVSRSFGGVHAVRDASLRWEAGRVHGLIGPNGAGKSTLVNLVTGVTRPGAGSITLGKEDLVGRRPWQIARAGVARTFQTTLLDDHSSVLDNVAVGGHVGHPYGAPWGLLPSRRNRRVDRALLERAEEVLELLGMSSVAAQRAGDLSYGARRLVEVARACVARPRLLLLDEPAAGLPHQEALRLGATLTRLVAESGVTVVLIEHNVRMVMEVCEDITVLVEGTVVEAGPPAVVSRSPKVIESYLGARAGAGVSHA